MITARKDENKNNFDPLLFRLTRRTIIFLFLTVIASFIYYIAGNFQLFLDSSQQLILKTVSILSAALIILCIAGCIEAVVLIIIKKNNRLRYVVHLALFIFAAVVGGEFQLLSIFLEIMSNGINF